MRRTKEERLALLRQRRAVIDAEMHRLQARERLDDRKADTRRKILLGAVVMQEFEAHPKVEAWAKRLLSERLKKPQDRALFGLPLIEGEGVTGKINEVKVGAATLAATPDTLEEVRYELREPDGGPAPRPTRPSEGTARGEADDSKLT